jgi:transcriptional regulator with XRE-family HTH domain
MLYMKLLQDLETYRLKNKLTQKEVANKLGVSFATVNRWLNGHTQPSKLQRYQLEQQIYTKSKGDQ